MNIKEIARAAGVSVATISRVLNHPEQVLPETREHVLAVMKEHHYTPNWFARGLNLGRTNTIALLVPNLELNRFQQLICGVETVARSKQYAVILCHTENDPAQELAYLEMVRTRHIDGVIFAPSSLSRQQREPLLSDGVPCVHVGRGAESGFDAMCYIDQEESAFRLTQHLLSLGHESIGLLLDDRLRTRFEWGLLADVTPPDFETRLAIVKNKAAALGMELPDKIASYIAENVTANVRQLEGTVNKILAYKDLLGSEADEATVTRAMQDILKKSNEYIPTPDNILDYISKYYGIEKEIICGQQRVKDAVAARQIAMYLIRGMTNLPVVEIGKVFDNRDHSTVLYSLKQVEKQMKKDPAFAETVKEIKTNINNRH